MRQPRTPQSVRMSPEEWAVIEAASEKANVKPSEVMRNGGLKEARRILRSNRGE